MAAVVAGCAAVVVAGCAAVAVALAVVADSVAAVDSVDSGAADFAEALTAATTNGAALLRMEKNLGAIGPGYFADMVAVEGNPLADIRVVIEKVKWVMKGGAVVADKTK